MSLKSSQLSGNATVVNIIDCQDYSIYIMFSILQLLFHFFFSLLYVSHYLFVTLLLTIFWRCFIAISQLENGQVI